jgi:hypothetical protein
MENMPGTLSPEEMARLQMFAEALRAPGIQQSAVSFNPAQGGGVQMPKATPGAADTGRLLGDALAPAMKDLIGSGSSTADFVPYSW